MDVTVFVEVPLGSRNKDEDLAAKEREPRGYGNRAEAEQVIEAARDRAASG